jgi:hypothetical protein
MSNNCVAAAACPGDKAAIRNNKAPNSASLDEPWIKRERFGLADDDTSDVRMRRVD